MTLRVDAVQPGTSGKTFQYLKGPYKKAGEGRFTRAHCDRKRENGFKGRFRLAIWKKIFRVGMVRRFRRLPGDVMSTFFLKVIKNRLDEALNNLF